MNVPVPFTVLALASLAWAQNVAVFPGDHAAIANGSTSTADVPYSAGISRVQAIYESWDLAIPNGAQITRVGFRPDGGTTLTGHALQLEVLIGGTTKNAADTSRTFADNYTLGAPARVFGLGLYQLPSGSGNTVWLDLATPHTFDANHNLLIEWRVHANSNGNARFTYPLDRATFVSTVTRGASGCPHSGGQSPDLSLGAAKVGGLLSMGLRNAPASSLVGVFFSINSPLVTPYPLTAFLPGISPGCQGQLALGGLLSFTDTTNTGGSQNWNFRIPNDRRAWNDATIASQAVVFDFFAPGGAVVSDAEMVEIGIDPAATWVVATGSATATLGSVRRNYGVVTLFQYQ